jgi:hypothetical protein
VSTNLVRFNPFAEIFDTKEAAAATMASGSVEPRERELEDERANKVLIVG